MLFCFLCPLCFPFFKFFLPLWAGKEFLNFGKQAPGKGIYLMLWDFVRVLFCHSSPFFIQLSRYNAAMLRRENLLIQSPFLCVSLLPFQFRQYLRRDTVNKFLNVLQFAFQLRPFHAVFHFAAFTGFGSGFQLFIFCQKVVYRDLVFFELPGEILHLGKPLFQHGEGFLFLLPCIERGNAVQRGFNSS